jgi:transposase
VVVCNRKKNALLKKGNKSDRIDARKLAELLARQTALSGLPRREQHTDTAGTGPELSNAEVDTTRVMSRLKAIYRGQAIPYGGKKLYTRRHRGKSIPYLGPIRAAMLAARVQRPHRFRSKRQFWSYCGLGLETRSSADYQQIEGQFERSRKKVLIRGLNVDHNHDLKNIFKGAAMCASIFSGPLPEFYQGRLAAGIQPEMARLTLARKIAAIALTIWKKGESFDPEKLKPQAA